MARPREPQRNVIPTGAAGCPIQGGFIALGGFCRHHLPPAALSASSVSGFECALAGLLWSHTFPINKNLWTSSYVLFAAGWSLLLLALCYWLIDIRRLNQKPIGKALLWPWLVFGSNAITAYVVSELPRRNRCSGSRSPPARSSILPTHQRPSPPGSGPTATSSPATTPPRSPPSPSPSPSPPSASSPTGSSGARKSSSKSDPEFRLRSDGIPE